jgi:RNA-directed DNA polymerase
VFAASLFGYRRGRSTKDAMRKVWKEMDGGREWIVDGDLKDFFGSVDHEKLLTLVGRQVADGRVLRLIKAMPKAGSYGQGQLFPSERGTPQGGVVSPLLSNILLTPFDQEMRRKGYQLTRYADDWVLTCKSVAEARAALGTATRILEQLGVQLNPQKTRIVHVQQGFDFLGYRIVRTSGKRKLPVSMIRRWSPTGLIVRPTRKSIRCFRDRVRTLTRRSAPRTDTGTESNFAGMGRVLQTRPHPTALSPTRRLDRAAHLGASFPPVADSGLEAVVPGQAVRRVWPGQPDLANTFS